ncbi:MAG: c-type cytochrome domain-containing protein [Planctomyces sp.]
MKLLLHLKRAAIVACLPAISVLLPAASAAPVPGPPITIEQPQRSEPVIFEQEILPILQKNCLACHSASERQGGLILETPAGILKGGDNGPAAVPGNAGGSLLLKLAAHQQEPVMPPADNDVAAGNLTPAQLGLLKLWIDQGARGTGGIDSLSPHAMQSLPQRLQPVQAVVLAPDGQTVAFSRGSRIHLHHVGSGKRLATLADPALGESAIAHQDLVQSLAFNADGDLLASGGFREVRLWRRPRDARRLTIALPAAPTAAAVSPDERWIAVAAADHAIRLFNLQTGTPALTLQGHTETVAALRFTADSTHLLSGSADRSLKVWKMADGSLAGRIDHPLAITAIEILPDPDSPATPVLATAGGDNLIRLWQMPSTPAATASNWPAGTRLTAFSPDRQLTATLDNAGQLRIHALQSAGGLLAEHAIAEFGPLPQTSAIAFTRKPAAPANADPAAAWDLLIADSLGSLQLWSLSEKRPLTTWKAGNLQITAIAASSDGKLAVTAAHDGAVRLWKLDTPAVTDLERAADEVAGPALLSPSGKLVATLSQKDGQPVVVIRSLENGRVLQTMAGHTGSITGLQFTGDDSRLATVGSDRSLRLWNLQTQPATELSKVTELPAAPTAVALNADGSQAAVGFENGLLRMLNTADSTVTRDFMGHTAALLHCSLLNGQLVSISRDASVRFWNPADGTQLRSFTLPAPPTAISLSTDSQRLLVASADQQVRLLQMDNGTVVQTLQGFTTPPVSVSIAPGSKLLAVTETSGQVSLWDAATGKFQESLTATGLFSGILTADASTILAVRTAASPQRLPLRFLFAPDAPASPARGAVFTAGNASAVIAFADGTLRGINPANGQAAFNTSHGAAINSLTVSDDGQLLATAGENSTVRVWNSSGQPTGLQQAPVLPGPGHQVAFSADGKQLLTATSGNTPDALLIDVQTGSVLERFPESGQNITGSLLLSTTAAQGRPAQTTAILAFSDGLRSRPHGLRRTLTGHTGIVNALAAFPGSPTQLLSGSADGTVRRWNTTNGQSQQQYNLGAAAHAVAVSPDGQRIAAGGDNKFARLWNLNGNQIAELRGDLRLRVAQTRARQQETAANARLNVAKQQLDVAEKDLPVRTDAEKKLADMLTAANADVEMKKAMVATTLDARVQAEKAAIEASAAARSAAAEKQVAETAAKDAAAAVQTLQARATRLQQASAADPASDALKQRLAAAQQDLQNATKASQERTAAVQAPTAKATELANKANELAQKLGTVQKPWADATAALKTAEAAKTLIMQQQTIAARELQTAQQLVPSRKDLLLKAEAAVAAAKAAVEAAGLALQQSEQTIRAVSFSPDGESLATAGDFPGIQTWDGKLGTALESFAAHTAPVRTAVFSGNRFLISSADDRQLFIWDTRPEWVLERTIGSAGQPDLLSHRVTSVSFSDDSRLLLVASGIPSRRGELVLFTTTDGNPVLRIPQAHDDVVYSAALSPDGRRIASAGADRYLRTFDATSGQQIRRFEGHTSYALSVAWKRDGQQLATAGADNTVRIWDAETGDQLRTIENFNRHATAVQWVGESDTITSASGDRLVRVHNASNGGLIRNLQGADSWLHCVSATPDLTIIAAGTAKGAVRLWNGTNGQFLKSLEDPAK